MRAGQKYSLSYIIGYLPVDKPLAHDKLREIGHMKLLGKEVNNLTIPFMRSVAVCLACSMFILGIAPRVDASFVPSAVLARTDRAADLGTVEKVLEAKMIKARLAELGLTHEEIRNTLSQLNDRQLHKFAQQLDNLKIAGDGGLGIVISVLVIAILAVLLLKLTGHRVIVK